MHPITCTFPVLENARATIIKELGTNCIGSREQMENGGLSVNRTVKHASYRHVYQKCL